jgi:hypothetical protein
VLLPSAAKVPELAAKFLDEVKVTARLQHRNIVQVLDFDRLADGTPFMVMERLRGRTLREALRETFLCGREWTPANTYAVAAQMGEALYRAHSQVPSIVHRDVKPENVHLHRPKGSLDTVVKVLDFGVAAVVGESERHWVGTPRYMPPEQEPGGRVSPQTDQYAFALVIYEMLTGRFAWEVDLEDEAALAEVHRRVTPLPPSRFCSWLPPRMEAALLKALAKDPADRHDTVHGLLFELRGLQSMGGPSSPIGADTHPTDPTMGTLADGAAAVGEVHDTCERMSVPPMDGPSPQVPALAGVIEMSVASSASCEPAVYGGGMASKGPDPMATRRRAPDRPPNPGLHPMAWVPEPSADAGEATGVPLGTPMMGASGGASAKPPGRRLARADLIGGMALLASSVAIAAVVLSAWRDGSPRDSGVPTVPSRESAAAPATSAPGARTIEAAEATAKALAIPMGPKPPSLPLGEGALAREPAKAVDRGLDGPLGVVLLPRPSPTPPQPAPHAAAAKAPIPDDGRDELYVPEAR